MTRYIFTLLFAFYLQITTLIFVLFFRWSQHVLCLAQHAGAYHHVLLLHGLGHGPRVPEVHLVEEVSDQHTNGKFSQSAKKKRVTFSRNNQLPENSKYGFIS